MASSNHAKSEIGAYFVNQYRKEWLGIGVILLLALVAVDYATGFRLHFTVMYAVPLMIFTWITSRLLGVILAIVMCTTWAYVDVVAGYYRDQPQLLYWDWGAVLLGYVIMIAGVAALRDLLKNAHSESRRDPLSGLVNKAGFYQVVGAEIEMCRRYHRTLSIAYIDCDDFKTVNDKFGHHVGDDLLRIVSTTMARKLRASDLAGRLGGDEFAVMLPETSAEACRMVIEMLQQRLLLEMKQHDWPVTFSIGIATFMRMPTSIEEMIRQADKLMYAVKHSSKGAIKQEIFGS